MNELYVKQLMCLFKIGHTGGTGNAVGRNPNHLLASLSPADWRRLEPHFDLVPLPARKLLEQPNRRIETVYFPVSGFASVVAIQSSTQRVEIGLIGREGMTGLPIVLGNHRSPLATLIQVAAKRIASRPLTSGARSNRVHRSETRC